MDAAELHMQKFNEARDQLAALEADYARRKPLHDAEGEAISRERLEFSQRMEARGVTWADEGRDLEAIQRELRELRTKVAELTPA